MITIESLREEYRSWHSPVDVVDAVLRIAASPVRRRGSRCAIATRRGRPALAAGDRERLPLWGVPFAVKDNIDVAGLDTTAACRPFAYRPAADATAVARLRAAGALVIGKTNLDQFATGLVGVRSPYGIPRCVFDPAYVSGGSSSGSAVVVARGQVAFALGTDTAGSGRVPRPSTISSA
jgi:allophanate hydrolase